MRKLWWDDAWDDYLSWQSEDKKTLKRVNKLIKDIERNGYNGIGKPEPLKGQLSGWWSVRIDEANRLVFKIVGQGYEDRKLEIYACKGHYEDK
jgi:toxin YoeB